MMLATNPCGPSVLFPACNMLREAVTHSLRYRSVSLALSSRSASSGPRCHAASTSRPTVLPAAPPTPKQKTSVTSDTGPPLWDMSHTPASWAPLLLLYAPFGTVLACLRILLWCGGVLLDRPSFRTRPVIDVWLALLGVRVTWKHLERLPSERHVLVSNHRSVQPAKHRGKLL